MMADVWKIGQNIKAADMWNNGALAGDYAVGFAGFIGFIQSDIQKANTLTNMCKAMSESYDQIIDDQNEYYVEIDTELKEVEALQQELDAKIKAQEAEKNKILAAAGDDGLSEEDEDKVKLIDDEIAGLTSDTNTKIEDINSRVKDTGEKAKGHRSKAEIATDYGNTAVEKGTPLSEMKDKRKSFWRKTFGGWNKSAEREAGKKAVEAGNNLLEQVSTASDIEDKIKTRTQTKKS